MNIKVILKNLLYRFSEAGVEVVLSGGLALSTMGVFRFTMDMNLVREYFRLFEKEDLLDEWIDGLD